MKAVAYLRVSTDEQHLGPEAQLAAVRSWAAANGAEIVATFEDLGVCGAVPLDRRPGLLAAIDAIEDLGAAVLVVAKRDRIGRDVIAVAMIERAVERVGARIATADGTGNGDGPEALLMRRMVDSFAEYERSLIRSRTRAALAAKKARGERVGALPYGARLAEDGVKLVADGEEGEIVHRVRALRAAGLSFRKIAGELIAAGLRPRSGGTWHAQTIKRIASAPALAMA